MTFRNYNWPSFFNLKLAAKVLAEEAENLKGKSAESSDVEEPQPTVFIDAPPPKVNVWLKKSDNPTQSQQQSAQENSSQDENSDQIVPAVVSDLVNKAILATPKPVEVSKPTAKIEPTTAPPTNSAAIMKESTADNRPPPTTTASDPVITQTTKVSSE